MRITNEAKRTMLMANLAGIAGKAYENYKLEWMKQHGFTLDDLVAEMYEINERYLDEYGESMDTDDQFKEFCENGFNGEIWASYDEFLDNEFQNPEIVNNLLDGDLFKSYEETMKALREADK